MANEVVGYIEDITQRLGKQVLHSNGPMFILRTMNRVYQQLNRNCLPVQNELLIAAGDLSAAVPYVAQPTDWIRPFRIEPYREYIPANLRNDRNSECVYYFFNGNIYFTEVDDSSEITIWYYSSGLTLVDAETPAAGEVNAPQYPADLQQIVMYATALELSADYPMRNADERTYRQLKSALSMLRLNQQETGPHAIRDGLDRQHTTTNYNFDYGGTD